MNNIEQPILETKTEEKGNSFEQQADFEEALNNFFEKFKEENFKLIQTNDTKEISNRLKKGIADFINAEDKKYMSTLLGLMLREFEVKDVEIMLDEEENQKVKQPAKEYLNNLFVSLKRRIG